MEPVDLKKRLEISFGPDNGLPGTMTEKEHTSLLNVALYCFASSAGLPLTGDIGALMLFTPEIAVKYSEFQKLTLHRQTSLAKLIQTIGHKIHEQRVPDVGPDVQATENN